MQSNSSTPQLVRNSCGFSYQDGFPNRGNTGKFFPSDPPNISNTQRHDNLAREIHNLEEKMETPNRSMQPKYKPGEGSPLITNVKTN